MENSLVSGCFSILPATELVPGDIVEVSGQLVKNENCEEGLLDLEHNYLLKA